MPSSTPRPKAPFSASTSTDSQDSLEANLDRALRDLKHARLFAMYLRSLVDHTLRAILKASRMYQKNRGRRSSPVAPVFGRPASAIQSGVSRSNGKARR